MTAAKVTSKGQITIPKEIRERQNLQTGDKVNFLSDDQGRIYFLPATKNVKSLKGIVPKPDKAVTLEDMKATVRAKGSKR